MNAPRRPTCAVIIPCYNGARFLAEAIGSLIDQSCPPNEIIVVDDGSTDGSAEIAARVVPHICVIRQENQGESVARNAGLRIATSDYVVFLDADDLIARDAIERLGAAVMATPGSVAVMGHIAFDHNPDTPLERWTPDCKAFFPRIIQTNFGPPHCFFTPRELALAVGGFSEDLHDSEDWDFWGRIALTGARLVQVDYAGALYRQHPHSQTAKTPNRAIFRGRLVVCERLATAILERPQLLDEVGEVLFWSLWALLSQARSGGVPASELLVAEGLLRKIARRGPPALRRSLFANVVRYFGVRAANRLRGLVVSP